MCVPPKWFPSMSSFCLVTFFRRDAVSTLVSSSTLEIGMGDSVSASPFADDELPPTSSGQKPIGDTAKRSTRPAKALTHLSCATFKSSRSLQAPDAVQVSLKAKAYAFLSMITGSAFSDGDHIADARAQVMTRSSNVGLIAALFLTIVVPIMYDAIYGAQTNAYMITDPAWVGILYFFLLAMSSWAFAMTSLFAILIILVTNQLSTPSESSYLFNIARAEFGRPVQYVVVGWNCMIVAVILWLIIAFFNLSAADECEPSLPSTSDLTSLNVSSDTQSQECKWYPELFIALLCGVNALSFHAMNSALKVR